MRLQERIAAQRAEGERIMAEAADIQRQVDAYVQQAQARLAELQQAFHRTEGAIAVLGALLNEAPLTRCCASFQGEPCDCDDDAVPEAREGVAR